MNAPSNYFLINRQLLDSGLWLSEPFSRGQAWVDLIGLATHTSGYIRCRGVRIDLERGQVGWSQVALSVRWRWSRAKTIRFLNELENGHQIVQQKNNVTSIISICNYDAYQGKLSDNQDSKLDSKRYSRKTANDTLSIKDNKRIINNTNTNVLVLGDSGDIIAKLFYEAIKSLNLPKMNNNNIRAKIAALKREVPEKEAIAYLEFIRDKYSSLDIEYKPAINEALDIYSKRVQVINAVKRASAAQQEIQSWKAQ